MVRERAFSSPLPIWELVVDDRFEEVKAPIRWPCPSGSRDTGAVRHTQNVSSTTFKGPIAPPTWSPSGCSLLYVPRARNIFSVRTDTAVLVLTVRRGKHDEITL